MKTIKFILETESYSNISEVFLASLKNGSVFVPAEKRDIIGSGLDKYFSVMNDKIEENPTSHIELEVSEDDLKRIIQVLTYEKDKGFGFSWRYEMECLCNHITSIAKEFDVKFITENF